MSWDLIPNQWNRLEPKKSNYADKFESKDTVHRIGNFNSQYFYLWLKNDIKLIL